MDDPTVDIDWKDENYEDIKMEFIDSIETTLDDLLALCHRLVETDGESIYEMED